LIQDKLRNGLRIREQFAIPNTQNSIAFRFEERRSFRIPLGVRIVAMLRTIELHNQFCAMASEIRDEWADRYLPAKVQAFAFELTQTAPQQTLGVSRVAT